MMRVLILCCLVLAGFAFESHTPAADASHDAGFRFVRIKYNSSHN